MSLKSIAEELGVSRETIANRVREFGLKRIEKPKEKKVKEVPPYQNKEIFCKVYEELRSFRKMAEYFNCSYDNIITWKGIHGVKSAYSLTEEEIQRRKQVSDSFSKENIFKMYIEKKMSTVEIAKELNCNPTTISRYLHLYNIPIRSLSEQWAIKDKGNNIICRETESDFQFLLRCNLFAKDKPHTSVFNRIKKIVGRCQVCGFNENVKILDVHHIDKNKKNNDPRNYIVLCPNCHAKVHRLNFDLSTVPYKLWTDMVTESYYEAK